MSTWRWRARRDGFNTVKEGPVEESADRAYALADQWHREGANRVSIHMLAPTNGRWAVADTREQGEHWVVGLERWMANEARALAEGRA